MDELLNQQWRSYVRQHVPAAKVLEQVASIDWDDEGDWWWYAEMALDATGVPRVMIDHGPYGDEDRPEVGDGMVLIACPVTEETTKQDLLDFDAAGESDWESEWEREDENEDEDE
jgi:hypothetical protein